MKLLRSLFLIFTFSLAFIACQKEQHGEKVNNKNEVLKIERVSLHISGMTCEIGCAKTIQSKLYKKEGVQNAKVIFTDSMAKITYDAHKVSKDELISFINGVGGGDLYKASEITSEK